MNIPLNDFFVEIMSISKFRELCMNSHEQLVNEYLQSKYSPNDNVFVEEVKIKGDWVYFILRWSE